MYLVGKILTKSGITITDKAANYHREFNIDMCWAHGMIGVCPVFQDYESAKKHGGPGTVIIEITATSTDDDSNINIIGEG